MFNHVIKDRWNNDRMAYSNKNTTEPFLFYENPSHNPIHKGCDHVYIYPRLKNKKLKMATKGKIT